MSRKATLILIVIAALMTVSFLPVPEKASASKLDEINKKIDQLQKQQKQADARAKKAAADKVVVQKQQKVTEKEINELKNMIEKEKKKIDDTEKQIDDTTNRLRDTAEQLDAAEKRVEERDKLLKSRLRLMYKKGAVNYLDVLFSATSFVDFLDRFGTLNSIVDQDKNILEDNIRDKKMIASNKAQIESDLDELNDLYAMLEQNKSSLEKKENEKEVKIAQLQKKEEELDDISEAEKENFTKLAKELAGLQKERNKLLASVTTGSGIMRYPLPQYVTMTSDFGWRIHPITKKKKHHDGIDLGADKNTDILAADSGSVILARNYGGYGNAVMIDHANGYWTLYAHMTKYLVKEGDQVKKGDVIGKVGSTGTSTGNHLHFEVRKDSKPIDPKPFIGLK